MRFDLLRPAATRPALLAVTLGACMAAPTPSPSPVDHAAHMTAAPAADAHAGHDMGLPPVTIPAGSMITEADVRFMQGMIAHHAQAVHMTRLAMTAGASERVLKLATKIDLSQAGEITLMQEWLREYGQVVPDTSSWRTMQMHGMLTPAEMDALAAAKGVAFDKMFLTLMIRHHEGAITMVKDLLASPRAGQEVDINVLANEIEAAQTAEIGLMWQMLADLD